MTYKQRKRHIFIHRHRNAQAQRRHSLIFVRVHAESRNCLQRSESGSQCHPEQTAPTAVVDLLHVKGILHIKKTDIKAHHVVTSAVLSHNVLLFQQHIPRLDQFSVDTRGLSTEISNAMSATTAA